MSVTLRFGFAEDPNVPAALRRHGAALGLDPDTASFFIGRNVPVSSMRPDLSRREEALFGFLAHNAVRASGYFRLPPPGGGTGRARRGVESHLGQLGGCSHVTQNGKKGGRDRREPQVRFYQPRMALETGAIWIQLFVTCATTGNASTNGS